MAIKLIMKYMLLISMFFLHGCYFKSVKNETKEPSELAQTDDTNHVEPKPVEPKPVEPKPVEPQSVEPQSVEPQSVEPKPVEPKPVEPKPVEPKPVEPEATESQSTFKLMGQITLNQSKLENKNADIKNTIVYFEPSNIKNINLPTTNQIISTQNKQFKPNVLAITVGSTVNFPNMDRILHNVFSVSPMSVFDLGLYSAGTTKAVTFENPGVIYVHCNVHHTMQADILVLNTPYFTQVDSTGNFELEGLPELNGVLKTWHPRGNIESLAISEEFNHQSIKQSVVISRAEVPEHSNKFGKSYRRKRY